MAHDASNNNPLRESMHALLGTVMLLVMIGGIAVSAWLRPAGDHTVATVSATEAGKKLEETYATIEKSANAVADGATDTAAATADSASGGATADATGTAATDGATATDGADATAPATDNAQTADVAADVANEQAQTEQATTETTKEKIANQAPATAQ